MGKKKSVASVCIERVHGRLRFKHFVKGARLPAKILLVYRPFMLTHEIFVILLINYRYKCVRQELPAA